MTCFGHGGGGLLSLTQPDLNQIMRWVRHIKMSTVTLERIMWQMFGILACKFPQQRGVPRRLPRPLACPPALSSEAANSDSWRNSWFAQAKKFCTSCQKYLGKTHLPSAHRGLDPTAVCHCFWLERRDAHLRWCLAFEEVFSAWLILGYILQRPYGIESWRSLPHK